METLEDLSNLGLTKKEIIKEFVTTNPHKYSIKEVSYHTGISESYVATIIRKLDKEIPYLENGEPTSYVVKYKELESIPDRVCEYLKANPQQYTAKEIAQHFNTSTQYVYTIIGGNPTFKKYLRYTKPKDMKSDSKRAKIVSFIEQNPNQYNIYELSEILSCSVSYIYNVINREPTSHCKSLVKEYQNIPTYKQDTMANEMKGFVLNNSKKYNPKQIAKILGMNYGTVKTYVNMLHLREHIRYNDNYRPPKVR